MVNGNDKIPLSKVFGNGLGFIEFWNFFKCCIVLLLGLDTAYFRFPAVML